MKKLFILAVAACGLFCSCSEDEPTVPAVGLTKVTVTPAGAPVSNTCVITGTSIENTNDSVAFDVAPEALQQAEVSVVATLGSTVWFNGAAVEGGKFVADVTAPITIEARGAEDKVVAYTLNVVQAKTMGDVDLVKKASAFNGFPANVVDYDVTFFKGKFYAAVVSLQGEVENYDIYTSENGTVWTPVDYTVNTEGVSLPDGQDSYVVGGEGASLVVFNDRLYVLGGARTRGADKFGNAAELEDGWMGIVPVISHWRSFSTADGQTFDCDTIGMSVIMTQTGQPAPANMISMLLGRQNATAMAFNGKMYLTGGYAPMYGMMQPSRNTYVTENGKDWTDISGNTDDGKPAYAIFEAARFVFNNKMWIVGGHTNFIDPSQMVNAIYSSEDGVAWVKEGDVPAEMQNVFGMKAVVADDVVYIFGGQKVPTADGEVASLAPTQMFRSVDGKTWEAVATPENYTAIRSARAVAMGNQAWIFGGYNSLVIANYGAPVAGDTWSTETWVKNMK